MEDRIAALDDAEALRLVQTIGTAFARAEDYETHLPPDLQATLGAAFDAASAGGTVSEGDLARAALQLYAEDPEHRTALTAMLNHPAPESLSGPLPSRRRCSSSCKRTSVSTATKRESGR